MSDDSRADFSDGVKAYYNRLAATYGDGAYFAARRAAVLAAISPETAGARTILDLGCGNGAFTVELAGLALSARVFAADLTPAMLRAARERLGPEVPLVQGDACALPFHADCFDLVFMSHVLLLIPDLESCIAAIANCLAPAGRLVATIRSPHWRTAFAQLLDPAELREFEELLHLDSFKTQDSRRRVAAACGSARLDVEWRTAPFTVTWPELIEWMHIRWFAFLDEEGRQRADDWSKRSSEHHASATLAQHETLLVATKW